MIGRQGIAEAERPRPRERSGLWQAARDRQLWKSCAIRTRGTRRSSPTPGNTHPRFRPVFWLAVILFRHLPARNVAQWRLAGVVRLTAAGAAPECPFPEGEWRHRLPVSPSPRPRGRAPQTVGFYTCRSGGGKRPGPECPGPELSRGRSAGRQRGCEQSSSARLVPIPAARAQGITSEPLAKLIETVS